MAAGGFGTARSHDRPSWPLFPCPAQLAVPCPVDAAVQIPGATAGRMLLDWRASPVDGLVRFHMTPSRCPLPIPSEITRI